MSPVVALALWSAELVLVAALGATPRGARFGFFISLAALAIPAGVVAPPFAVLLLGLALLWCAVRAADFVFDSIPVSFTQRMLHLVVIVDTRLLARGAPRLDGRALLVLGVAAASSWAAVTLIFAADELQAWRHFGLRWLGGALLILAAFECLVATLGLLAAGFGWSMPVLHDSPHLARTVGEFWGRRWNRTVSEVLRVRAFVPLARRSPVLALFASFALSALIHAYLIGVALGPAAALVWAAFFLVQPFLILAERRLRVRRWAPWAAHAWSVGVLGLLSPLMIEPGLRLF